MAITTRRTIVIERSSARFAEPLRISGYVFDGMPSVVVTIGTGECLGRGEAAGVYYLGDDQDRMVADIKSVAAEMEAGAGRTDLQSLLPPCGARNALDCALWELDARIAGTPVWSLAGLPRPRPLITTFTLPVEDPAVLSRRARDLSFAKADPNPAPEALDESAERLRTALRAAGHADAVPES